MNTQKKFSYTSSPKTLKVYNRKEPRRDTTHYYTTHSGMPPQHPKNEKKQGEKISRETKKTIYSPYYHYLKPSHLPLNERTKYRTNIKNYGKKDKTKYQFRTTINYYSPF